MKTLIFPLLLMLFTSACFAQEMGKTIDYQYEREEANFNSYALYLSDPQEKNTLNLVLTSSSELKGIAYITIGLDKKSVKIPFKKIEINLDNDNSSLYNLIIRVDLSKLLHTELPCDTKITFTLLNSRKIQLPFNTCNSKTAIPKN